MMSTKLAVFGLLKLKIVLNKSYGVITSFYDITSNILWRDSNYTVDVVMCLKSDNSSIFMREVIATSILNGFDQKNQCF